jgi:hypothetical protein
MLLVLLPCLAMAGPIVIDGTDANDHGSFSTGANQAGWLYMQRVFENLASQCIGCPLQIHVLGATGSSANAALLSAFNNSSLPGAGWSMSFISEAGIAGFLGSLSFATTGILHIPTVGLLAGDLSSAALGVINGFGAQIAAFVNAGGGLFAMGESPAAGTTPYGWLTSVIPGIVVTNLGGGGVGTNITLTAAGALAFPGLTNADLAGADPWHNYFSGSFGSLSVLGTASESGKTRSVILGGGAGAVIDPIPEPSTAFLLSAGLAVTFLARYRRKSPKHSE